MPEESAPSGRKDRSLVERALGIFGDVRAGEGPTALLLSLNVFLLLLSYYLLKTAREPLILMGGGAEVKSYASAGQSLLLIPAVKLYAWLGRKYDRMRLITTVTIFFAACLVVFFVLAHLRVPLGIPFFLWVGVFNVSVIAQFWSFAADIYSEAQGKRLFAILGIGSSIGAVAGAYIAKELYKPMGPYQLMLVAGAILLVCLFITRIVHRREGAHSGTGAEEKDAPLGADGGFSLLMRDKYLLLIGALMLILNCVNSTGEYILDRTLIPVAEAHGAANVEAFIGEFKGRYFEWVNIVGVVLQLFVVSRVLKYLGVRVALFVLPTVALAGYGTMAFAPFLSAIFAAKVAENSLDYSLQNTSAQALFLVTSREEKYKAKAVISTFLVRAGDVLSALLVVTGTYLGFKTGHFIMANIGLVCCWLGIVWLLTREHRKRSREDGSAAPGKTEGGAPTTAKTSELAPASAG